jgi:hypothetical protein
MRKEQNFAASGESFAAILSSATEEDLRAADFVASSKVNGDIITRRVSEGSVAEAM